METVDFHELETVEDPPCLCLGSMKCGTIRLPASQGLLTASSPDTLGPPAAMSLLTAVGT